MSRRNRGVAPDRTSALWLAPWNALVRGGYLGVAWSVAALLARAPGVDTVLLSGALAQNRHRPGRQGIDLTVVGRFETFEAEWQVRVLLQRVQRSSRLAAHLFYDLELVDELEVASMLAEGGLWEHELRSAWVLAGSDPRPALPARPAEQLALERAVYALRRWFNVGARLLVAAPSRATASRREVRALIEDLLFAYRNLERGAPATRAADAGAAATVAHDPLLQEWLRRQPAVEGDEALALAYDLVEAVSEQSVRCWAPDWKPSGEWVDDGGTSPGRVAPEAIPGGFTLHVVRRHPSGDPQPVLLHPAGPFLPEGARRAVLHTMGKGEGRWRRVTLLGPWGRRAAALLPMPPFAGADLAREVSVNEPPPEILQRLARARLAEGFTALRAHGLRPTGPLVRLGEGARSLLAEVYPRCTLLARPEGGDALARALRAKAESWPEGERARYARVRDACAVFREILGAPHAATAGRAG